MRPGRPNGGRRVARPPELPRAAFLGVAVSASVLLIVLSRGVFLFWDDFLFLGDARDADLDRAYLTSPLFTHFSPVTRFLNWLVAPAIAGHPWVVAAVLAVLLTAVASAVTWLMIVLHGRTWTALAGAVLLAPSLTLVPLGNWWTAGANIMPALAGFLVAFGAFILVLRGRSRWWALPCLAGAAIGVLDYELPMLLPGYLGLWVLLFRSRITDESLLALVRRTWWLWLGLFAVCGAAAANYRLNYYAEVPGPATGDLLQALGRSLTRTLVPTLVGFHDPRNEAFSTLSLVIGCLALAALVGWLLVTRQGAWRGLLFAAAGWALPSLALILNRVALYGVVVVDNAIYFFLPSALFVVGVLEAVRSPRRVTPRRALGVTARRVVGVTVAVVVVTAYALSAGPTARYQLPPGASDDYVDQARAAAERQAENLDGDVVNVLDSDVPGTVVPPDFAPANRASNVLGLTVPGLVFDDPEPPFHQFDQEGRLHPVDVDWLLESPAVQEGTGPMKIANVADLELRERGACFTTEPGNRVTWTLPRAVTGPGLVVRTEATANQPTSFKVSVRPEGADTFEAANYDVHELTTDGSAVLDTVAPASVRVVRLSEITWGVRLCLSGIAVGKVVPGG